MKNGKALHKIIGCGVVMLAVFVFAGTGTVALPATPVNHADNHSTQRRLRPRFMQNWSTVTGSPANGCINVSR